MGEVIQESQNEKIVNNLTNINYKRNNRETCILEISSAIRYFGIKKLISFSKWENIRSHSYSSYVKLHSYYFLSNL